MKADKVHKNTQKVPCLDTLDMFYMPPFLKTCNLCLRESSLTANLETSLLLLFQLIECPDHGGYWTMFEVISQMGGTILPAAILVHCLSHPRADVAPGFLGDSRFPVPQAVPWTTLLPLDATLNCLFSRPSVYRSVFPQQEGTLFLSMPGNKKNERKI